jgi:hypothetical protein
MAMGGSSSLVSKWIGRTAGAAAVAALALGCAEPPSAAAVIADKTYTVRWPSVAVTAAIITGAVTDMKVTERVRLGSDLAVTTAKFTGTLTLRNTSADQTVQLVTGKLLYIDTQGRPISLDEARPEPTVRFPTSGRDRLDPGQEAIQFLAVEFPAEALRTQRLGEIRLELAYIPSPYRTETVNVIVSIGEASKPENWFPLESAPIGAQSFDGDYIVP